MIFKRRDTPSLWSRVANFVWPKTGFARGWTYITKRVQRLSDKPERIALGFALGAFASFTPFFGLHFAIAGVLAYLLRGNIIASFSGTVVGNPLTFPFIAGAALSLGRYLTGSSGSGSGSETVISDFFGMLSALWNASLAQIGIATKTAVSWSEAASTVAAFWHDVMTPYLVGGGVLGVFAAVAAYFLMKPIISAYHQRRRIRFESAKRRALAAKNAFVRTQVIG